MHQGCALPPTWPAGLSLFLVFACARRCPCPCPLQASPYTAGSATVTFDHPCDYFTVGKVKASTLSLSVLVAIEML